MYQDYKDITSYKLGLSTVEDSFIKLGKDVSLEGLEKRVVNVMANDLKDSYKELRCFSKVCSNYLTELKDYNKHAEELTKLTEKVENVFSQIPNWYTTEENNSTDFQIKNFLHGAGYAAIGCIMGALSLYPDTNPDGFYDPVAGFIFGGFLGVMGGMFRAVIKRNDQDVTKAREKANVHDIFMKEVSDYIVARKNLID
jgi:hypothetical protein|tara:strand:- start:8 stop:601 length:594 start_codon:yes stop_codon:yes gene_type:complete